MTRSPPRDLTRIAPLAAGLLGLAGWVLLAVLAPQPALQGWLIGFVFTSCLSLGSLAVVLIHRLTAGAWGEAFAPELESAARATPILLLFSLPILIGLPLIYPWAANPGGLEPGVHRLYLNAPFFILRSAIALIGWSLIAWRLPRIEGPRGRLGAGLALAFHGIAVSVVSVDWLLSIQPSWTSSDVGMDFAVQQLSAAFAFAALQGRRRTKDQPSGDIAGLLLATIIGLTYLEFMSYLVVWYGDRPALDVWYLTRARWPWQSLSWVSLAFGLAAVAILAGRRAVGTHRAVALAGGCVLTGVLVYQMWLLASGFGLACLVPAAFALIGQGGVWLALVGGLPRARLGSGALAHAA